MIQSGTSQSAGSQQQESQAVVSAFIELYGNLNRDNLHLLDRLYHPTVIFTDPLHRVEGRDALKRYFAAMYENLLAIKFDIHRVIGSDKEACIEWTMHYAHRKLRGGQFLQLDGVSLLTCDDLITRHRDYFDAGAMLYEHLPLLGGTIRLLKNRVAI
ncbi:MAG: nuclear transport factor 2 family protein [Shewanella sp.]|nr:nuclear transport factor 2 family protein [Shewanella sp.]MCF1429883.1 nuclear transport factor 2 family protein [Shewanella sp.]MCF1438475.1 nuclear transport factor 2 family protein [Shewanella sp.]MCF1457794.1 nuclear transport factor 2 family protein [Shewanella sp.]